MILNLKIKCLDSLDQVNFLYGPFCSLASVSAGVGELSEAESIGALPGPSLNNKERSVLLDWNSG